MLDIKPCVDPTPPPRECRWTSYYGYPKGICGRPVPVQGIVIHCLGMSLEAYANQVCSNKAKPFLQNHASVHYAIAADGKGLHQYVDPNCVAWGLDTYSSNFKTLLVDNPGYIDPETGEPPPASYMYPGWPILSEANAEYPLDMYAIHIGIAKDEGAPPSDGCGPCDNPCDGFPLGMNEDAYKRLVRLVAWLSHEFSIPVNSQYIARHAEIANLPEGENDCDCTEAGCFLCDIQSYCEGCLSPRDRSFALSSNIKFVYGEDEAGCKVKVDLDTLAGLLGIDMEG